MKISDLYPTHAGEFEIEDCEEMNNGLNKLIYEMRDKGIDKTDQYSMSGKNGYHTNFDLLKIDNKYVVEFHKKISAEFIEYYHNTTGKRLEEHRISLVAWAMIYGPGAHSIPHTHPSANLAMSYYTKVPKNMSDEWESELNNNKINSETSIAPGNFHTIDPRPAARWDVDYSDCSSHTVEPREGLGVIFPGWLEHYVSPHYVEEDRVCIAINLRIL